MSVVNIKDLHREDLIRLVEYIQREEPGRIDDYFKAAPPVPVQLSVEWLHATICNDNHPPCNYYEEDEYTNAWVMPAHMYWQSVFFDIAVNCGISVDEFRSCIGGFGYLAGEADRRKKAFNPNLGPFLESILRLRPDALIPALRTASSLAPRPLSEDLSIETASETLELSEPVPPELDY